MKPFLDTNILIEIAKSETNHFSTKLFYELSLNHPRLNIIYLSDLVLNETHSWLTNRVSIQKAASFIDRLLSSNVTYQNKSLKFVKTNYDPLNFDRALELSGNSNYIYNKKGLTLVDSLLLLQMEDENGIIYSGDLRMSYFINKNGFPSSTYFPIIH